MQLISRAVRWVGAIVVVFGLPLTAHAQSVWSYGQHSGMTTQGECFAAQYYPGAGHIAIQTHIHYVETGEDEWYWNEGWDYVDNGGIPFDINKLPYQNHVECEGDGYGVAAADGSSSIGVPSNTSSATR